MDGTTVEFAVGQQVSTPGHFLCSVVPDEAYEHRASGACLQRRFTFEEKQLSRCLTGACTILENLAAVPWLHVQDNNFTPDLFIRSASSHDIAVDETRGKKFATMAAVLLGTRMASGTSTPRLGSQTIEVPSPLYIAPGLQQVCEAAEGGIAIIRNSTYYPFNVCSPPALTSFDPCKTVQS